MTTLAPGVGVARQRLRAAGAIASKGGERAALDTLHQSGGAKIRLPRSAPAALSAVLLNTAGGLTGGDEIRWRATAGAGSRLSVATAASEKVYRTHGPDAVQHTALAVGAGARLDWLPQETILFDGARLRRTLHATLAADARLLIVEAMAFGRRASGETLRTAAVHDSWRVHRGGRLLHAEALRIDGVWQRHARRRGALDGNGAMATVLYCSPAGAEALARLADELGAIIDAHAAGGRHDARERHARQSAGGRSGARDGHDEPRDGYDGRARTPRVRASGGASALEGRVVLRLVARSGFELRRILLPCLTRLQGDASLPRVWHV